MSRLPEHLGALRASPWGGDALRGRGVRDELRAGLLRRIREGSTPLPGVVGFDDTVVPALHNAILSRHSFILLGLRGQAKSRILRGLVALLDEVVPVLEGCEIHDDPFRPICASCKQRVAEEGDGAPVAWLERERRFVEKLATPDVTVADIIGDLDPIRAARGTLALSDERTVHYGLLPRANRGIFAMNELPDLAGKVQVSLFNVMQEGDVQIKGYPIRLPLDVALVFTANPEDYTARGKIITPLKDRIGSEIRTHYPAAIAVGMAITRAEAWTERPGPIVSIPPYVREVVEGIAFAAREDARIDRRSGVSQRLPIRCLENVVSNAERRALRAGVGETLARIADVYAALPAVTGKLELEYEGEMRGAEVVARDLVRIAVGRTFDQLVDETGCRVVVQWFDGGGMVRLEDDAPLADLVDRMQSIPGLVDLARGIASSVAPDAIAGAAELILEGLVAKKRISRSEEKLYMKAQPTLERGTRGASRRDRDDDVMQ